MRRSWLLIALSLAPAAHAAYKCVDENGLAHFGDTPPAACASVPVYEISASGMVLRRIDPTPTPEQLRQRRAAAERKREADKVAAEQRRKDMALINTFSSEEEFDVVLERSIEPINGRIRSARERIQAIDRRQQALADELEFYKAGKRKGAAPAAPPAMLVSEVERLKDERRTLTDRIADADREIAELRERFQADKQRWIQVKHPQGSRAQSASGAQPVTKGFEPAGASGSR